MPGTLTPCGLCNLLPATTTCVIDEVGEATAAADTLGGDAGLGRSIGRGETLATFGSSACGTKSGSVSLLTRRRLRGTASDASCSPSVVFIFLLQQREWSVFRKSESFKQAARLKIIYSSQTGRRYLAPAFEISTYIILRVLDAYS